MQRYAKSELSRSHKELQLEVYQATLTTLTAIETLNGVTHRSEIFERVAPRSSGQRTNINNQPELDSINKI